MALTEKNYAEIHAKRKNADAVIFFSNIDEKDFDNMRIRKKSLKRQEAIIYEGIFKANEMKTERVDELQNRAFTEKESN